MCRRVSSPFSLLKRIAAVVAATIYLTGCGIEIVDVTAPTSVTGGQPFEIEVTQQFFDSGSFIEEQQNRLVFVFVVPEAWSPQAGGSYDGEFDGVPLSLNVEVLDTIESGWNDLLYDPEFDSPCLEEYAEVESAQEQCALNKALDAIEFVPFFYGGPLAPPDDPTYQLLYVRTEVLPTQTFAADDTGVLTMPFAAAAGLQPAEATGFVVASAIELSEEAGDIARERLPADLKERWPSLGAGAADAPQNGDVISFVWWLWGENDGLTVEIDGYEVPVASVGVASVRQFAGNFPVPIGGPALFALIALGLVGLGISAGRKKRRKIQGFRF